MIPPRPSRDGDDAWDTLNEAGLPVFKARVRRLVAFQKAALQGVVVCGIHDPRAPQGWSDYVRVGKELIA
jgi:chromosome partitioning protein